MSDIAKLAEVSVSTVSRALSGSSMIPEPLRDKIQKIAEENGYVVNIAARNLRLQTTQTIGLVLPLGHETGQHITDPFLLELIGNLSDEVLSRSYDVLLSKNPAPRSGWLKELIQSHKFDGLLIIGQSDQHEAINLIAKNYMPCVVWGEKFEGQNYCTVGVDNIYGGQIATEHLISKNRKNIIFLGPLNVPEVQSRFTGYENAIKKSKLKLEPIAIDTRFTFENAQETVKNLIRAKTKFDGIFAASDVIANGAISALIEAGIQVPKDVSVCGFDDVAMSKHMSPPLTTIRQDIGIGAKFMVDLLFQRMNGEKNSSAVIPARLMARGTS